MFGILFLDDENKSENIYFLKNKKSKVFLVTQVMIFGKFVKRIIKKVDLKVEFRSKYKPKLILDYTEGDR